MRKIALATLLVSALAAAPAAAQSSWKIGASAGVTLPIGDAGDVYKTGFGGGVSIMRHTGSKLAFGVDAQLHRLGLADAFDEILDIEGNLTGAAAFGRVDYAITPNAYLIGGAGLFRSEISVEDAELDISGSTTDFAVQAGLGLNFGKSLFVEGKLINVFSDETARFIPITVGVRF
jgi:hypothetical protein